MKLIHWLGWVVAAIALILIYRRDVEIAALKAMQHASVPAQPPASSAAPSPILAPPPEPDRSETTQMLARIAELEARLVESQAALDAASSEAERFRNGLEDAVAELNRQERPRARPSRGATTPPSPASNVRVWTPETSHVDDDLVVAGKVHNLGGRAEAGAVIVAVYDDTGELVGEERVEKAIEPGALDDYYVRMPVPRSQLRVEVRWESS